MKKKFNMKYLQITYMPAIYTGFKNGFNGLIENY